MQSLNAPTSLVNLLEMQIFGPYPRPPESDTREVGPSDKPPGITNARIGLKTTGLPLSRCLCSYHKR